MTDEPTPKTKQRRWQAVILLDVPNTPDPVYDVAACERLTDELEREIAQALRGLAMPRFAHVEVDTLQPMED